MICDVVDQVCAALESCRQSKHEIQDDGKLTIIILSHTHTHRSCFTLIKNAKNKEELVKNLHQQRVPRNIIRYLEEATKVCGSQTEITAQFNDQYYWNVNQATR